MTASQIFRQELDALVPNPVKIEFSPQKEPPDFFKPVNNAFAAPKTFAIESNTIPQQRSILQPAAQTITNESSNNLMPSKTSLQLQISNPVIESEK